jgi:imidazolonepropionase-like amidohydrolase
VPNRSPPPKDLLVSLFRFSALAVLSLLVAACAAAGPPQDRAGTGAIAFVGATVLPMAGPDRLTDQTVIIAGDRIAAVGPRARVRVPAGARRIDARGLTLMPGLVDMHVHLAPEPGAPGDAAQRAMAVMLAHGVTTARGMAGSPANLVVRGRVEQGALIGPRLYAAAPGLHVNNSPSAEAARAAVAAAHAAGYDLIKAHHIMDVAIWEAVQDEAARRRLPVAGHVTNPVGLARAMAAGQQVEHLDGVLFELLAPDAAERAVPFAQIPPPAVVEAAARAAPEALAALAARAAGARSWHVPTLALFDKVSRVEASPDALLGHPNMAFVPEQALRQWRAQRLQFIEQSGYTPQTGARLRDLRRRIVQALHEAGVPVMAGSDTAQSFHIWGPGLIEEIEALAEAGLGRMAALRTATVVPRDYFRSLPNGGSALGWRADFGTVEPGARADLILLAGDPSLDLGQLRRLQAVVAGGRYHDRAALDALLENAARDVRAASGG